jgi:hypothetical protein
MSSSVDDEIAALRIRLAQVLDPSAYPSLSEARRVQEEYGTAVPLPACIERTSVALGGVPTERLTRYCSTTRSLWLARPLLPGPTSHCGSGRG